MILKQHQKLVLALLVLTLLGGVIFYAFRNSTSNSYNSPKSATKGADGNDFSGIEISGEEFSLSRLSEKPIIIHFWASWCGPCVNEFPKMIRFIESFNGKIHLVALSADESDEDIKSFLAKIGVSHSPFIHIVRDDGGKIAEQYKAKMLPTSVILVKGLKVEKRIPGEVDWEDPKLREIFESILTSK